MHATTRHAAARLALAVSAAVSPVLAQSADFRARWPSGVERPFPGPDFYGNRLLDWRVANGRLECLEGSRAKPMRTLHLLTRAVGANGGRLSTSVRTGPITPGGEEHEDTWTGFLIGAGGPHVDHRISALCHHWPAADGGLIAALDGTGALVFRDNSRADGPKGPRRDIDVSAWPLLEGVRRRGADRVDAARRGDLELRLEVEPRGEGHRLTLSAIDPESRELLAEASLDGVPASQVDGSLALASHRSAARQGPGYWYRDWRVSGSAVETHPERAFGPVVSTLYTLSRGVLTLNAQMAALGPDDTREAELQVRGERGWTTVARGRLRPHSSTIPFRVEGWDGARDHRFRVLYALRTGEDETEPHAWEGTIRRDPKDRDVVTVAGFTGHHISADGGRNWNAGSIWYPHDELVAAVAHHDPDLLFFSGDQIYEGGLAGIVRDPPELACLDYLYHWYRWCWAFRELTRDRPTIAIPDDHDVYHGNIWGSGGIRAPFGPRFPADQGGYLMDPLFVNAVHRTQTDNLPPPFDPTPIEQGITVYHTDVVYGGLSFAVIADRMWKSSPTVLVPEGRVVNGWFQNPDFDPRDADVPGAVLLGERQLRFLDHWAADWSGGAQMKVLLSQTLFANVATLPREASSDAVVPGMRKPGPGEYVRTDVQAADADSNGWPQTGRNQALRAVRRGFAFHLAGDQHLGSFVHYGVEEHDDAAFAFCVPSIANVWPRRWFPPRAGSHRAPGAPEYTGRFEDGFGNRITVHAVSNPIESGREPAALYDRAPGYGIVRFDLAARTITAECWPRWEDPSRTGARQYPGWPITVHQWDNYGREAVDHLPLITVRGVERPVVRVVDEADGSTVYAIRMPEPRFRLPVFRRGTYTVEVGEPDRARLQTLTGVRSGGGAGIEVDVR